MIFFPCSKINLGLNVVGKRPDGYHDIVSVMVPVGWTDVLEILPGRASDVQLTSLGRTIDCPAEKNLVVKAYRALERRMSIPAVDLIINKIVPDGAGLGGGSADAAAVLKGLNKFLSLSLPDEVLAELASEIGADCPFFIYNRPMLATGIGTELSPIDIPQIQGLYYLIVKPQSVSISTAMAYAGIKPEEPEMSIQEILSLPIEEWQGRLVNDFEKSIFPLAPEVERVKEQMIERGALYASMSGSGSAVYGLFPSRMEALHAKEAFKDFPCYLDRVNFSCQPRS